MSAISRTLSCFVDDERREAVVFMFVFVDVADNDGGPPPRFPSLDLSCVFKAGCSQCAGTLRARWVWDAPSLTTAALAAAPTAALAALQLRG